MNIPCPFVYANGKRCDGEIDRIEAYRAELVWERSSEGKWRFNWSPGSHYHLFCSKKGNHAGYKRPDSEQMKLHWGDLPGEVRTLLDKTDVQVALAETGASQGPMG
jgi:hypothetical protein